jgi:hypothetical protein
MDGQQMDQMARSLARGMSRRSALKGVLGGAAGGALALLGARQSYAVSTDCRKFCSQFCRSAGSTHRNCRERCFNSGEFQVCNS